MYPLSLRRLRQRIPSKKTAPSESGGGAETAQDAEAAEAAAAPVPNNDNDRRRPPLQLPQNYVLQSGEEDETVLLELRGKTWRRGRATTASSKEQQRGGGGASFRATLRVGLDERNNKSRIRGPQQEKWHRHRVHATDLEWLEVGTGPLKVLQSSPPQSGGGGGSARLVQRRESTPGGSATVVILNLPLSATGAWTVTSPSEKHVQVMVAVVDTTTTAAANNNANNSNHHKPQTQTYLLKFKLPSEATALRECLEGIAAAAVSARENADDDHRENDEDDPEREEKEKPLKGDDADQDDEKEDSGKKQQE